MIQNLMKLLTICITLVTLAPTLEKGLIDNDSSLCVSFLGIYRELLLQNDDANYCSSIRTKKDRNAKGTVAQWLKEPQ